MDLVSIIGWKRAWYAYRDEFGTARGGGRTECDCARHVAVDGSVSAGIGDMTVEGGDGTEECGVGFGITFEVFHVGENTS